MKEVKHLLRKAYYDVLKDIKFDGKPLQVVQNYLPTKDIINTFKVDSSPQGQAYIVMSNQTVNDDSPKCLINQNASIQLDIVTVMPSTGGSTLLAEKITDKVFELLFPNGGNEMNISIPDMHVWRSWLVSSRTIEEVTPSNLIYRNILIFNHSINQ